MRKRVRPDRPDPARRPGLRLAVCVALAAGVSATGLAACSSDDEEPGRQPAAGRESPAAAATPSPSPRVVVAGALLEAGDVGTRMTVQDDDAGLDAPTNDICGKDWATNDKRVARRQLYFWPADAKNARTVVSNEVVMYEPGETGTVLAELEQAVGACDGWKHGQGRMRDVRLVDPPENALAGSVSWTATDDRAGAPLSYVAVYQVKGDVLGALYVWADDARSASAIVDRITPKIADRIEETQN